MLFEELAEAKRDILLAMLVNAGFEGFEESELTLKACISKSAFSDEIVKPIVDLLYLKYTKSIIREENWNQIWESDFTPVEIFTEKSSQPFVCIRAAFHKPDARFRYDIVITPKMSFGTGHHPTTHLMVALMASINFENKKVIDFGTGTAILAILAEKLGAKNITGIDCDDWSINNATENIHDNNCHLINIVKATTIAAGTRANIILANINLNIIAENIQNIKVAGNKGATFLFSGVMAHDEKKLLYLLGHQNFDVIKIEKMENWLAVLAHSK